MIFSNLSIVVSVVGDGRNDKIQIMPIAPTNFATTAPPGALGQNSPAQFSQANLQTGNNVVVAVGSLQTSFINNGYTLSYVIVVPPTNSLVAKTMKGATGDTGVALNPAYPLILALPTNLAAWQLVINAGAAELVDLIFI